LNELLVETAADAAFLAMPGVRSAGGSFSIIALHPSGEQRARVMTRWIRRAVCHALESGCTMLAVGRWRAAPDGPKRSALLIVASVFNDEGAVCGALAILLPATFADSTVVALVERSAHVIRRILMRRCQIPALSSLASAWTSGESGRGASVLAHELRVPLSAASYALQALAMRHTAEGEGEDDQLIHTAQFGLTQAQSILRSSSQSQAIGSAMAAPDLRAISLKPALERALALFPAVRSRLHLDLRDDPPSVRADEVWLTQVLTNLLENALKYSWPRTPITVAARPNGPNRILITVRSFGEGVPASQRQLFARDAIGVVSLDLASKGLGLGIVRRLITGMGGEIWAESDERSAIEVMLTLPLAIT
jgi:signal transduction histidine kinase